MKPTEVNDMPWIMVHRDSDLSGILEKPRKEISHKEAMRLLKEGKLKSKVGKWLVFCAPSEVNNIWDKIKVATIKGKLGGSSKVSTAMPSPLKKGKDHVICVYTKDYDDKEDVMRVRRELSKLGITKKIPYKTDESTMSGKYSFKGDKKISMYFE